MEKEKSRGNLSEMEQIHKGLEAFLEKEVYREYEAGQSAGREECARYEEADEYEDFDEYGGYREDGEYNEYEDEEMVRADMAGQSAH
ncbi:MAG: hypothetical protein K2K19_12650, partial [Acetatifactor sp.]|nr:hypothetical protein [Acetatifactor sp.]